MAAPTSWPIRSSENSLRSTSGCAVAPDDSPQRRVQRLGKAIAKAERIEPRQPSSTIGPRTHDRVDRVGGVDPVNGDVAERLAEHLLELAGQVLPRVVAIPGALPFEEPVRTVRRREQREPLRIEHAADLPEQRLRIVEVRDHLERNDEVERAVRCGDRAPVVGLEVRAVPGSRMLDDLGVHLDPAVVGPRRGEDLRSVALSESDIQNASARLDETGGGLVGVEVERGDGELVRRRRFARDEPDGRRLQRCHLRRTQCWRLTRLPKSSRSTST